MQNLKNCIVKHAQCINGMALISVLLNYAKHTAAECHIACFMPTRHIIYFKNRDLVLFCGGPCSEWFVLERTHTHTSACATSVHSTSLWVLYYTLSGRAFFMATLYGKNLCVSFCWAAADSAVFVISPSSSWRVAKRCVFLRPKYFCPFQRLFIIEI